MQGSQVRASLENLQYLVSEDNRLIELLTTMHHTMTNRPNCPAADYILEDVRTKVESVEGVKSSNVNLVFEPAWDQSMMSEEARVELGFD